MYLPITGKVTQSRAALSHYTSVGLLLNTPNISIHHLHKTAEEDRLKQPQ